MKIGSLFSGIGGLELGLEMSGLGHTVWQVEQSEFCREVLAKHWPNVRRYEDVKEVGKHNLEPVDLICGGFPCQDISSAGKGAGLAGKRSGLWSEFARILSELTPSFVVVENVASGAKRWVDQVCDHLGQLGYEVLPVPLSASGVGAWQDRPRVFVVAYSHRESKPPFSEYEEMAEIPKIPRVGEWWPHPFPIALGTSDGVPRRMDRLRALGNAVVPQCAEVVGYVIRELMGEV